MLPNDAKLLEIIRHGPVTIVSLAAFSGVTPTAVRNRLERLIDAGLVTRTWPMADGRGRGRPAAVYEVAENTEATP